MVHRPTPDQTAVLPAITPLPIPSEAEQPAPKPRRAFPTAVFVVGCLALIGVFGPIAAYGAQFTGARNALIPMLADIGAIVGFIFLTRWCMRRVFQRRAQETRD